jgi:cytochrome c oxidase subunit 3
MSASIPHRGEDTGLAGQAHARSPFKDEASSTRANRFGMTLFLISLGVLFAATALGILIIRIQLGDKNVWPNDLPAPPGLLLVSTLVLVVSSITMEMAHRRARRGERGPSRRALVLTLGLGAIFVVMQGFAWLEWWRAIESHWVDSDAWRLALSGFYIMTGLHAAHVIGGLIALGLAWRGLRGDAEGVGEAAVIGVERCTYYWHFLGAAWVGVLVFLAVVL